MMDTHWTTVNNTAQCMQHIYSQQTQYNQQKNNYQLNHALQPCAGLPRLLTQNSLFQDTMKNFPGPVQSLQMFKYM